MSQKETVLPSDGTEIASNDGSSWKPDVYYFPTQVAFELTDIQDNVLGKILTLVEVLGLSEKQEKSIKDLIRTIIKEQMIGTRKRLQSRLNDLLKLGMVPVEMQAVNSTDSYFFDKGHLIIPIYKEGEEKDF